MRLTAEHQVFHCNFLALSVGLDDKSVDHSIIDTPYEQHTQEHQRRGHSRKVSKARPLDFAHLTPEDRRKYAIETVRITKRWAIAFTDHDGYAGWKRDLLDAGATRVQQLVWVRGTQDIVGDEKVLRGNKGAPQFNGEHPAAGHEVMALAHCGRGRSRWNGRGARRDGTGGLTGGGSVYYADIETLGRSHITQKPVDLLRQLVREYTDPGDLVMDGFCGSGTTFLAAKIEDRRSVGCDIDLRHAAASARRVGVILR